MQGVPMEGCERGYEGCKFDEEDYVEGARVAIELGCERGLRERARKEGWVRRFSAVMKMKGLERGLGARVLNSDEDEGLGERKAGCEGSHRREGSWVQRFSSTMIKIKDSWVRRLK